MNKLEYGVLFCVGPCRRCDTDGAGSLSLSLLACDCVGMGRVIPHKIWRSRPGRGRRFRTQGLTVGETPCLQGFSTWKDKTPPRVDALGVIRERFLEFSETIWPGALCCILFLNTTREVLVFLLCPTGKTRNGPNFLLLITRLFFPVFGGERVSGSGGYEGGDNYRAKPSLPPLTGL